MYHSIALGALFFTAVFHRLAAGQFVGTIVPLGNDTSGMILVTIENNSTGNYSVEARNNLFDDLNPYRPLTVKTVAGIRVPLVGSQYPYGQISDAAFISMGPGAVWQRELNMTEYIPADPTLTQPTSQCFSVAFTSGMFAVNTTDFVANEDLATGFLKGSTVEISIRYPALHLNITVEPATALLPATATTAAEPVGTQLPAALVQGTAAPGLGRAAPLVGTNINDYTQGVTNLFAPAQRLRMA